MIVKDDNVFPNNVVGLLKTHLAMIDSDVPVQTRPIRESDPQPQVIGVFPTEWTPTPNSEEFRGMGVQRFPTLASYTISVQAAIADPEEERGISVHNALAARVRATVARKQALHVSLASLVSVLPDQTERFRKLKVERQRYMTMELQGTWLYLSVMQILVETESS